MLGHASFVQSWMCTNFDFITVNGKAVAVHFFTSNPMDQIYLSDNYLAPKLIYLYFLWHNFADKVFKNRPP